jgi:hypothetical protein
VVVPHAPRHLDLRARDPRRARWPFGEDLGPKVAHLGVCRRGVRRVASDRSLLVLAAGLTTRINHWCVPRRSPWIEPVRVVYRPHDSAQVHGPRCFWKRRVQCRVAVPASCSAVHKRQWVWWCGVRPREGGKRAPSHRKGMQNKARTGLPHRVRNPILSACGASPVTGVVPPAAVAHVLHPIELRQTVHTVSTHVRLLAD